MGKGCKVVVCGHVAVGKTAIVEQLVYGNHIVGSASNESQEDVYVASVETERGVREQLRIYDTRGLHDAQELPKHYYSVADGFVLVYSVDSIDSFRTMESLKKEVDKSRDKKEVTVIVLGNKNDIWVQRQVEQEAAQQWARTEKVKLWEVSTTEHPSLIEPFTQLTSRLTQPQSKSAFPLPGRKSKGMSSNDI
ncbi:NF-kappa-B inhibitor-interacting Ras-like protein 1 [Gouania willdenowi]|uniref:NF-kappa-B inhibitor-interacting Ras-like protein 1 n=1 Tax=Gouania willdenowi TaxID=441366 RepID=A0A8C5EAR5_GOUWI|nr:NF-kappa-B inhibitor-interacting Ras-like protein 1 [Gouania willdenowi]XP_028316708.1 NF-kappa-B inhibitor-interacting Ras-like protein 1 [Gouania willdenowi]